MRNPDPGEDEEGAGSWDLDHQKMQKFSVEDLTGGVIEDRTEVGSYQRGVEPAPCPEMLKSSIAWPPPIDDEEKCQAVLLPPAVGSSRALAGSTDLASGSCSAKPDAGEQVRGLEKSEVRTGLSGLSLGACSPLVLQRVLEER